MSSRQTPETPPRQKDEDRMRGKKDKEKKIQSGEKKKGRGKKPLSTRVDANIPRTFSEFFGFLPRIKESNNRRPEKSIEQKCVEQASSG